jgi:hypothetical protein
MPTILDNSHHMPVFIGFGRVLPQLITLGTIPRVGLISAQIAEESQKIFLLRLVKVHQTLWK